MSGIKTKVFSYDKKYSILGRGKTSQAALFEMEGIFLCRYIHSKRKILNLQVK